MFLPDVVIFLLFVAGVGAMILGFRKLGVGLLIPVIIRWLVFPIATPLFGHAPLWLIGLALVALPFVVVFAGVKMLQGGVHAIYGPRAAGNVASVYLVRIFDKLTAVALWLLALPFRLIGALIAGARRRA
jgi:hypothetical protein